MPNLTEPDTHYRCNTCKALYALPAAMTNNAGSFCQSCDAERARKSRAGMAKYYESRRTKEALGPHVCLWCGQTPRRTYKKGKTTCVICEEGREWLLRCIRATSHAASYVARVEAKEGPLRQERQVAAKMGITVATQNGNNQTKQLPLPTEIERLDRIENAVMALQNAVMAIANNSRVSPAATTNT